LAKKRLEAVHERRQPKINLSPGPCGRTVNFFKFFGEKSWTSAIEENPIPGAQWTNILPLIADVFH